MSDSPFSPQQLQEIHDWASRWGKTVARQAFGEAGPGLDLDLTTFEQVADAAARGLAEGVLATLLEQQAQALPDELPCPACGRLCRRGREPRTLRCRGTPVPYQEPVAHCPDCRRDFFPPAARPASRQP